MRVHPADVADEQVSHCVSLGWDMRVTGIDYAPVGFGSHHWWLASSTGRLFATVDVVRPADELAAALGTAAALRQGGLEFVHAPLLRSDDTLLGTVAGRYPICVHRWLDGAVVSDLSGDRSAATIELLARLHAVSPSAVPARRADLVVQGRAGFDAALRRSGTAWPGPYGERARRLLLEHRDTLARLFVIHDRESAEILARQHDWVITHGEPHAHNLVEDATGLHLVDWDTTVVAPAARDVWQIGGHSAAEQYRELTGRLLAQWELDHFRRDWDLAEICLYTADFAAPHERTADTDIMWGGFTESLGLLCG